MPAFDFKKEYKDLYMPKTQPALITVPPMTFFCVEGEGDPNEPGGAYGKALELLYALSYTVKMSRMGTWAIEGYFPYVVPPLEGLWWMQGGAPGVDYGNKAGFRWISMIRQPDFVTEEVFALASAEVARKKGLDPAPARRWRYEEGLCAQVMHIGTYDDEPATVARMTQFIAENGYVPDLGGPRRHHEIYLGDPRKIAPEARKTVIRHPVKPQ